MWGFSGARDLPFDMVVRSKAEQLRALYFWHKEPETLAWIESMSQDGALWDIGANVGVYSLYAAARGVRSVAAFEPCAENFARLCANVHLNPGFPDVIDALQVGFSKNSGSGEFHNRVGGPGYSGGQLYAAVDETGAVFPTVSVETVDVCTIDDMARSIGVPTHIKIDVDGAEYDILQGAAETLGDERLKSVLVEVNSRSAAINEMMVGEGFTTFNRFNGADINRRYRQQQQHVVYTR
jgi:FkbM family methyltransferase